MKATAKDSALKRLSALLPYLSKHPFSVLMAIISLSGAAIAVLGLSFFARNLIDMDPTGLGHNFMWVWLLVVLLALSSFGRSYFVSSLGEKVISSLRQDIFNHILKMDVSFFDNTRAGELVSRLNTDTNTIQLLIGGSIGTAARNLLMFTGGLIMMFFISTKLTLAALIVVPLVLIVVKVFGKKVKILSKDAQDGAASLGGYIEECFNNIRTVQAFGHEDIDRKTFAASTHQTLKKSLKRNLARSSLAGTIIIVSFMALAFVIYLWSKQLSTGDVTVGKISSFMIYVTVVAASASSFGEFIGDVQRASGAAERLFEMLLIKPAFFEEKPTKVLPKSSRGIVAVHGVSFSYPQDPSRAVLDGITLSVAPGEKLALVGRSGCGKSTMLSLLMRFYDPQVGSIFMDGVNIKSVDVQDLRRRIGWVSQEPSLFSASIYDNILYGRPNATEKEVWQAAEFLQVEEFLSKLPHGIHTKVGPKGVFLSGGQKQRVAIARAILRNPSLLLLDEATSALDTISENAVQRGLSHLTSTRTTIVVAHRLSTVLNADNIAVMEDGKIRAIGNHAELIMRDELYRKLATLQFNLGANAVNAK